MMEYNYDVDNAPLNMGLLVWMDTGIGLLSCALEKTGLLRDEGDPKQEFCRSWRSYPNRDSRKYEVYCYLVPDLPEVEKFKVKK